MGTVRRIVLWLAALAAVAPVAAQGDDPAKQLQKLIQAFRRIEGLYVDDVETGPLVERAIERMLEELDPHLGLYRCGRRCARCARASRVRSAASA